MNDDDKINSSRPGPGEPKALLTLSLEESRDRAAYPGRRGRKRALGRHLEREATRTRSCGITTFSPGPRGSGGWDGPLFTRQTSPANSISNRDWKLLEIAVTQTKQTMEVQSNRDKIAPPSEAN